MFSLIFLLLLVTEYSASGSGEGWESGSGSASGSWGESGGWEEHSGKRAWSDDEDLWEKEWVWSVFKQISANYFSAYPVKQLNFKSLQNFYLLFLRLLAF